MTEPTAGASPAPDPANDVGLSTYSVETKRLVHGPVGGALTSVARPAELLAENILESLDQGDGWIVVDGEGGTWYPGRLAVQLRVIHPPERSPLLQIDTEVVHVENETGMLRLKLNDLNVHAAG